MRLFRHFLIATGLTFALGTKTFAQNIEIPVFTYHTMLKFVENKGQWVDELKYRAELPGGMLYVRENGLTFHFFDQERLTEIQAENHDHSDPDHVIDRRFNSHVLKLTFQGSNSNIRMTGQNPYQENINFYIGKDPSKWGENVKAYQKIVFHNIYDNIDLHLFRHGITLKYEFIVHPGADPDQIQILYEGADELDIINNELVVKTTVNQFKEAEPYVYQNTPSGSKSLDCEYRLRNNTLSFKLKGRHNQRYPLVIDPQLIFSSYSGSVADNWGNTACVDQNKNLFTGGTIFPTRSGTIGDGNIGGPYNPQPTGFPATPGAYESVFQGGHTDVGILKFDSAGTTILYATYLGGSDGEIPTSTNTNTNNELYVLVTTASSDFPVTPTAYDTTHNGGSPICGSSDQWVWTGSSWVFVNTPPCDVASTKELVGGYNFYGGADIAVVKLSADGGTLLASTFVGGSGNDGILYRSQSVCNNYGDQLRGDINIDSLGNVYVASTTQSSDFPIVNGFQSTFGGGVSDACSFRLTSNLDTLVWSTYLGGADDDAGFSIQRDSLDNVYVSGGTASDTFPTTAGALHPSSLGGVDGFVSHISSDGTTLLSSTRVGTSSFDQSYFVQLDEDENVYLLGQTKGVYPITSGTYNDPGAGQFIHKLGHNLDTTYFSTTFGSENSPGVPDISPTAFLVNECGNMFVSGWGGAVNAGYNDGDTDSLPITSNAYQTTTDGSDFYLLALRKDADSLIYATYFGGNGAREHVDGGTSRFDKSGIVYQSVCAGCGGLGTTYPSADGFPISSAGVASPTNNSLNCNNGVFKFDLANLEAIIGKPPGCLPLEVTFENNSVGGIDFTWKFGDGNDTTTATAVPVTHTYDTTGTYTVTLIAKDQTTCIGVDSTSLQVTVNGQPPNEKFEDTTCINTPVQLTSGTHDTAAVNSYSWSPSTFLNNPNIKNPISTPTSSIRYLVTITDSIGCEQVDTVDITVDEIIPEATWNLLGNCAGAPKIVFENKSTGFPPITYTWDFGDGGTSTETDPEHQYSEIDTFTVVLTATNAECSNSTNYEVILKETWAPNVITPNEDGVNDYFVIENIEDTGDWKFEIYNRWGERVYLNKAYSNNWNGVNNHDGNLNPGTYFYLITSPDGTLCKGWVEIFR